ncbi:MAG: DUF1015 domain-containing protein [Elusimicrobia bacterium]|nr:DUF1015 domain-containing protein [Elusimicrobiota bacterium]
MPIIIPFRAIRYNKKNISSYICPPYDIIPKEKVRTFRGRNLYNAVRIELPSTYFNAKREFERWKKKKILIKDELPSFYLYEQKFCFKNKKYTRTGFFTLVKTEKFGKSIFPHEKTHLGPKKDRLKLLKTTKINTSPIFCLFSDNKNIFKRIARIIKNKPPSSFSKSAEISEKMWVINDNKIINILKNLLKNNKILIADGHHRYETFYGFTRGGGILTFLCPFEDKGLLILPTHRLVKEWTENETRKLQDFFRPDKKGDFNFYIKNKMFILKVPRKFRGLPIEYLHLTALKNKNLEYVKDKHEAVAKVKNSSFPAAVIVKPLSIEELKLVVKKKLLLPQKSTYFYPKVSTGIVFNEINADTRK